MTVCACRRLVLIAVVPIFLASGLASAAEPSQKPSGIPIAVSETFWTSDMYRQAHTYQPPVSRRIKMKANSSQIGVPRGTPKGGPPGNPSPSIRTDLAKTLFHQRSSQDHRRSAGVSNSLPPLEPQNRGTFQADYTSSRVFPDGLNSWYPYRTVGKIFFSFGSRRFACSGAVISARIVITAGHCVYEPGGAGWANSVVFVPGFHKGEAPYGEWHASHLVAAGEWYNGSGSVPNRGDFGVLVISDKAGSKIGNVVGWLGWYTNRLTPNHVTILGYPKNHDNGGWMHQVTSGAYWCCDTNNAVYGGDMRQGASGGPWVQNFGEKARGQKGGRNKLQLRVVGVTSGAPVNKKVRAMTSSYPGSSFVAMMNMACDQATGNCSR